MGLIQMRSPKTYSLHDLDHVFDLRMDIGNGFDSLTDLLLVEFALFFHGEIEFVQSLTFIDNPLR